MTIPAEIILRALTQIVEPMYFREVAYLGPGEIQAPMLASTLSFQGPIRGSFTVAISAELARALTGDFLVEDSSDISVEESKSMVRELTNIVCGSILAAWMPSGDFLFSTPQQSESARASFPYVFSLDGFSPQFAISVVFHDASL